MNLMQVDLNLLTVLDALLSERHVSRAGERVGLSQPATSAALARLRATFNDPLLERDGNRMRLTARAAELREPLTAALTALRAVFDDGGEFDARSTKGTFRIATTDFVAMLLLPRLQQELETSAPELTIELSGLSAVQQRMDEDELDLVIGTFDSLPSRFRRSQLFTEHLVCLVRTGHPSLSGGAGPSDPMLLEDYLKYPHLRVSPRGDDLGSVSRAVADLNVRRHIGCIVQQFSVAPFVVESTDLIATLPARIAIRFADVLAVSIREAPLRLKDRLFEMVWHERRDPAPFHRWMRERIAAVCEELDSRDQASGVQSS